jgi:exo-beta-1,3-glucanase (GH17 family)
MSGSKINGPTLAITDGASSLSSITDSKGPVRTVGALSFSSNGSINTNNDYVRKNIFSYLKQKITIN